MCVCIYICIYAYMFVYSSARIVLTKIIRLHYLPLTSIQATSGFFK